MPICLEETRGAILMLPYGVLSGFFFTQVLQAWEIPVMDFPILLINDVIMFDCKYSLLSESCLKCEPGYYGLSRKALGCCWFLS